MAKRTTKAARKAWVRSMATFKYPALPITVTFFNEEGVSLGFVDATRVAHNGRGPVDAVRIKWDNTPFDLEIGQSTDYGGDDRREWLNAHVEAGGETDNEKLFSAALGVGNSKTKLIAVVSTPVNGEWEVIFVYVYIGTDGSIGRHVNGTVSTHIPCKNMEHANAVVGAFNIG